MRFEKHAKVVSGALRDSLCTREVFGLLRNARLKSKQGNFDSIMALSGEAVADLKWWINSVEETSKPGKQRETRITMTTDASKKGWGALWRVPLPGAHGHTMKPNIT